MNVGAYDFAVVGAGPAGCVLASRLSADPVTRVALIEAGPDLPDDPLIHSPFPISVGDPRLRWKDLAICVSDPTFARMGQRYPTIGGFGVGGGSNIYGMVGLRGTPQDYDGWQELGIQGWSWEDVLPYFRKVERDQDFASPLHGTDGLIPVRRVAPHDWSPVCRAMGEALAIRGFPILKDPNSDYGDGVGPIPMLSLPDRRVSAAMAYLGPEARRRPNLHILADTHADRLLLDGKVVTGLAISGPGGQSTLHAHEVIVSGGAIHSPALLLRSGIGSAACLAACGVEVQHDLPGVGQHLKNHPAIALGSFLPKSSMQNPAHTGWGESLLRYSSAEPGCPPSDMSITIINKATWHPLGHRLAAFVPSVFKSSSTGQVRLKSASATDLPEVSYDLSSADLSRLHAALRLTLELLCDPAVKAVCGDVLFPREDQGDPFERPTFGNRLKSGISLGMLSLSGALRKRLLGELRIQPEALLRDEEAMRDLAARRAMPVYHFTGTCKMGAPDDADAVLDARCRVRGLSGLRVVDSSVMPDTVRGNTQLPVLMIGEKIGADIIAEGR